MSFRVFEGNVLSENGWRMCNADECVWAYIPGTNNGVSIQVRSGIPATILVAFLARFNKLVEPLRDQDTACWTLVNDVSTSNHPAGTACDANWGSHPFHVKGTYGDRLPILRQALAEFRGCVWYGGDWQSPIDEMHFQLNFREGYLDNRGNFVLDVDQRLVTLANDLKAGYLGVYSANANASVLSQAMGNTAGVDYPALQPAVAQCLAECDCTTVDRIAMWMSQVGHESAGLKYMEEIASGAAYEGRADLGNTQPGDGVRFKGRGPIQVTGRHNYTVLSQWAFDNGLVPSPTFFVDNPAQLASTQYGFIGVTWYWTTQRPMNDAADARDLVRATQYVNGGQNGIDDRRTRYNRALAMGDQLLTLLSGDDDLSAEAERKIAELHAALLAGKESRSGYATPGEGPRWPWYELVQNVDSMEHERAVEDQARAGDMDSLVRVVLAAKGQGTKRDAAFVQRAQRVLAEIEAAKPEILQSFLAQRGQL